MLYTGHSRQSQVYNPVRIGPGTDQTPNSWKTRGITSTTQYVSMVYMTTFTGISTSQGCSDLEVKLTKALVIVTCWSQDGASSSDSPFADPPTSLPVDDAVECSELESVAVRSSSSTFAGSVLKRK